jgi:hypothetical protein
MSKNAGARFGVAVDGKPRSYRDRRPTTLTMDREFAATEILAMSRVGSENAAPEMLVRNRG